MMDQTIDQKAAGMFYVIYHNVFDENSEVKLCTRVETTKLIEAANILEPDVKHGDPKTGVMQVFSIMSLYDKLCKKIPDPIHGT